LVYLFPDGLEYEILDVQIPKLGPFH